VHVWDNRSRRRTVSKAKKRDIEKERYWAKVIREATRSGNSIREFCRRRKLKEGSQEVRP
jgi:hypothetical protein